jgi:PadR family transcriptional regulator PadR
MTLTENLFENLRLELRRGCLTLAVLAQLRQERYGYTLRKALADDGLVIDESTLYPLLRRLEAQGLLASEWREEEKRNKRFYRSPRTASRSSPSCSRSGTPSTRPFRQPSTPAPTATL